MGGQMAAHCICDQDRKRHVMDIISEDGPTGGRYSTGEPGAEAVMTFSRASPRLIIIDHTEEIGRASCRERVS
jgi:hypothetical protein